MLKIKKNIAYFDFCKYSKSHECFIKSKGQKLAGFKEPGK